MKYIFLDFNGTVLDDVNLCLDILNTMLNEQGVSSITIDEYRNVFTFPIEEYYKNVGFDFNKKSFKDLSIQFINLFQKNSMIKSTIYNDVIDFILKYKKEYKFILCSASQIDNLLEQVNHFKIKDYFDDVIGLNDISAKSKKELAKNYIINNDINLKDVLFIGDTKHDYEVASYCDASCFLVSCGHQSKEVLESVTKYVYNNLSEIEIN